MKFNDMRKGRLFIIQRKTGHMLAVPLNLTLSAAGINIRDVIEICEQGNPFDTSFSLQSEKAEENRVQFYLMQLPAHLQKPENRAVFNLGLISLLFMR